LCVEVSENKSRKTIFDKPNYRVESADFDDFLFDLCMELKIKINTFLSAVGKNLFGHESICVGRVKWTQTRVMAL